MQYAEDFQANTVIQISDDMQRGGCGKVCSRYGEDCLGDHEYEQMDDEPVIHSYFRHIEADKYFGDMHLLYKEVRVLERIYEGKLIKQGFIDYILKK